MNGLGIGGAENYSIALMNKFIQSGLKVTLTILSNELTLKTRLNKEIDVRVLPRSMKFDVKVMVKLRKIIIDGSFNCIVSSYNLYTFLPSLFISKIVVLYPIHSTIPLYFKDYLINYILFRLKRRNETYISSIDAQTKYLEIKYGLKSGYFHQIYNGIDTGRFTYPPKEFNKKLFKSKHGIPNNHKIILMVAGFRPEKRHLDAIDAFSLLSRRINDVSLLFVGNDNLLGFKEITEYVASKSVQNVIVLTSDMVQDVLQYYWIADIFTLTSDKVETFSISSLEAMSCGVPCVLTQIGGAEDYIIRGQNGELCMPRNIEDIANKWYCVLANLRSYDPNTIRTGIMNKYSLNNSVEKYIELIKSRMGSRT